MGTSFAVSQWKDDQIWGVSDLKVHVSCAWVFKVLLCRGGGKVWQTDDDNDDRVTQTGRSALGREA